MKRKPDVMKTDSKAQLEQAPGTQEALAGSEEEIEDSK